LLLQRDFLATMETLTPVAVLQGTIYHLDTVYNVFVVGVGSVSCCFCGVPEPIPCPSIF
jgi:hypothetical protein